MTEPARIDNDRVWELFHETSKIGPSFRPPSDQEVLAEMEVLWEALPFVGYPIVELPRTLSPLKGSVEEVLSGRISTRDMRAGPISLVDVATILHYAYGITRDNKGTEYPRPFRIVPSGGGLYPLEIFYFSAHVEGIPAGLYHYNPVRNDLRLLREGDESQTLSEALVQRNIPHDATLIVFITAAFEKSVFKYGERGYRFVMLEAGHVAQNINIVANALGLGTLDIGGFYDHRIDEFVGLDGLTHSAIYLIAIGNKRVESRAFEAAQ
jgi:SagB-type dehydrogenase family enzyme